MCMWFEPLVECAYNYEPNIERMCRPSNILKSEYS